MWSTPIGQEVWDVSQIALAFQGVRPPPFVQSLIVAILTYLLQLVKRLFQRCHLSRIDEVLRCGDSMVKLYMPSQIQSSCLNVQLSVCAPRILTNFYPFHVKFLFYTDKIKSNEWQDLVPRQRTGNCLLIHIPRQGLCDQPLLSHQNFFCAK